MRAIIGFLMILGLAAPSVQAAEPVLKQAIEAGSIELLVDPEGNGYAIARECNGCPLQLTVTPETRFTRQSSDVTLDVARTHSGKGGTVVFEIDSKKATRMMW